MNTSEITDKTRDILSEQLGADPAEFSTEKTWADYGADSLDEVEIVMAFEEEFGLDIGSEDSERLAKMPISEGILWLESQLAQ
jgi:acyl carrier protein